MLNNVASSNSSLIRLDTSGTTLVCDFSCAFAILHSAYLTSRKKFFSYDSWYIILFEHYGGCRNTIEIWQHKLIPSLHLTLFVLTMLFASFSSSCFVIVIVRSTFLQKYIAVSNQTHPILINWQALTACVVYNFVLQDRWPWFTVENSAWRITTIYMQHSQEWSFRHSSTLQ